MSPVTPTDEREPRKGLRKVSSVVFAAAFAGLTLSGCSSVPDAVNPVEWYKGTVDFFAGEEEDEQMDAQDQSAEKRMDAADAESQGKEFPKIADVPDRPKPAEGLVADSGRRYADAPQRQGEAVDALAESDTAPPPPPVPTEPVASAPLDGQAPSAPAMAEAPQADVPPLDPSQPTDVMDVYRQNLAQTRPQGDSGQLAMAQPSGSPYTGAMPASPAMGMGQDFGTVVISGGGIDGMSPRAGAMAGSPSVTVDDGAMGGAGVSVDGMVKVATILFGNGSAALDGQDRGVLKQVQQLQRQYGARVLVVGHASSRTRNMDPVTHKMVNYQTSVERAETVAHELVRMGIPAGLVDMDARSDADPVYYEVMPSGEAGNRRAEVFIALR